MPVGQAMAMRLISASAYPAVFCWAVTGKSLQAIIGWPDFSMNYTRKVEIFFSGKSGFTCITALGPLALVTLQPSAGDSSSPDCPGRRERESELLLKGEHCHGSK